MSSSLPRTVIRGFKDNSGTPQVLEEESLPIHLPLFPLFTEWGPADDALLVGGGGANAIYGANSFDGGTKYGTHQTELASRVLSAANLAFIRRLVPEDAATARLRLCMDVLKTEVPAYERRDDGKYRLDESGQPIPTGSTIQGLKVKWIALPIDEDFGIAEVLEGTQQAADGTPSELYPIADLEARFPGERGNNIGFRMVAPTSLSSEPANLDLIEELGAFIYRFYVVRRADAASTAVIANTMFGEQYVPFTFKPNSKDRSTGQEYFADDVILQAYESEDPEEFAGYGHFARIKLYHENLQEVLSAALEVEEEYGLLPQVETPEHCINLLTGVAASGVPYYALIVDGPGEGGLLFSESSNHFAQGGSDGTLGAEAYDQAVATELEYFGEGEIPYFDTAMYPFSCMYDTGFSMETKKKFSNVLQRRDVWLAICTQDANRPLNSASEESSMAVALRAHFRSVPESEYYGTQTCRVVIVGHAGNLVGSRYKGILPFVVAFGEKCARYMGAATGYMNPNANFERAPGSTVSGFIRHNAKFKPVIAKNRDWNNGLIFAQNFDRKSIHWPGLQTIYDDNTSVLNSFFNMVIACNLTRIGERAWRVFVGDSQSENSEFLALIDEYIVEQTNGRYHDRVDVTPRSYYTAADEQRGYSWHTDITFSGQGIKTVETLTIISERRGNEDGAA